jgi:hypothetical protein
MDALTDLLSWYGLAAAAPAGAGARYSVEVDARLGQPALHVHTRGTGYTTVQVLGALHAVAASMQRGLLVLPLPPEATGQLRVALGPLDT